MIRKLVSFPENLEKSLIFRFIVWRELCTITTHALCRIPLVIKLEMPTDARKDK
jgi:hypothetical protein